MSCATWLRIRPCRISVSHKLSGRSTAVFSSSKRSLGHVIERPVKSKLRFFSVVRNLRNFILVQLRALQLKLWLPHLQVRPKNVYRISTNFFVLPFFTYTPYKSGSLAKSTLNLEIYKQIWSRTLAFWLRIRIIMHTLEETPKNWYCLSRALEPRCNSSVLVARALLSLELATGCCIS